MTQMHADLRDFLVLNNMEQLGVKTSKLRKQIGLFEQLCGLG